MSAFNENNVLTIKTVQIAPFRTLMTALKDILLETNITFQPDGIKIINMDKSHTILAHLHLKAENFELYECKQEKIVIGVNMFHLFKLINSIDNDDTLTLYIENADYNEGVVAHLGLKFENGDIDIEQQSYLRGFLNSYIRFLKLEDLCQFRFSQTKKISNLKKSNLQLESSELKKNKYSSIIILLSLISVGSIYLFWNKKTYINLYLIGTHLN